MRNNKNILRTLFLGMGLTILSCTDNKRGDIINDEEEGPDDLIKKDFIELAKNGSYKKIFDCFSKIQDVIDVDTIKGALDGALYKGNIFYEMKFFRRQGVGECIMIG